MTKGVKCFLKVLLLCLEKSFAPSTPSAELSYAQRAVATPRMHPHPQYPHANVMYSWHEHAGLNSRAVE